MIKHNQDGAVSGLTVSLVLAVLLLIGAIVFGAWAFSSRQDYKNNTDAKINTAVTAAKQQEGSAKDAEFAQEEKNPLQTWNGPEAYGSISLAYPKTWSGYLSLGSDGSEGDTGNPVDAYFYPKIVPSIGAPNSIFALRVQVVNQSYASVVQALTPSSGSSSIKSTATITPYTLPKLPKIVGVKVTGAVPGQAQKDGIMVIMPLRSETIKLWTESNQFANDFNNSILPNFSFSP